MAIRVARVALLVREYDEAIAFYRDKLGFRLLEDTDLGGGKRWVRMAPEGPAAEVLLARAGSAAEVLLAQTVTPEQTARIGDQSGGRVFLFIETDDFARDHAAMLARGVRFLEAPRREAYGMVAVFVDLYGNKMDLIQPVTV